MLQWKYHTELAKKSYAEILAFTAVVFLNFTNIYCSWYLY